MPRDVRVSVLLPVRDAEPWLAEAVDSVLVQSEPSFELIAVDDGSTDASAAMLADYARRDRRVQVLSTRGGGRGIVEALNLALEVARAPYVARMDADDRMHPCRLAMQVAALDDDSELFGVSCRARAFPDEELRDGMRAYLEWQNGLVAPEELARDRFIESPLLHPSVMMRTEPLRHSLGGWRDAGWPEDWDLFLRAFESGLRLQRLPELLFEWRLHAAQATRTDDRYSEAALLAARAHFLARALRSDVGDGRALWILGAGPVGKTLVKALANEGLGIAGLADVDSRKIGGVVRDGARSWPVIEHSLLRGKEPRPFAVSAVAGAAARARVRAELARWRWREGADFVVAA
ncbi:MAG: glycosyltransferase [Deltaproteobacteria bacterium]|nr:glycosyltransferase [Deltaproteobacteria bacterium]